MKTMITALAILLALPARLEAQEAQDAPRAEALPGGVIEVGGVVLDEETGEPLQGVAVHFVGTEIGTLTGASGFFSLREVPNRNAVLSAQRLGYIPERRLMMVCQPAQSGDACQPRSTESQVINFLLRVAPPSGLVWQVPAR